MPVRKVHCEVIEGLVYEDRCLFKLSKIIEGNKTCEECILREVEKMKLAKRKNSGANDKKDTKDTNDIKDIKKTNRRARARSDRKPRSIANFPADQEQPYTVQFLSKLLEKSERRIQELAKEGKIPAHKVGRDWNFIKAEIDRWLSENKTPARQCHDSERNLSRRGCSTPRGE